MKHRYPVMIVEGLSFALAVKKVFPRRQARNLGGLGHNLSAAGIARRALPLVRLLMSRGCRIVLSVDRETRQPSAVEFGDQILAAFPDDCRDWVTVVVADRMLENWLLADVKSLTKRPYIRHSAKQRRYEGTHGKEELRSLFVDITYDETTHAPELMAVVRRTAAVKNSDSFAQLIASMAR